MYLELRKGLKIVNVLELDQIVFIEYHDAEIGQIEINKNCNGKIQFDRLVIYSEIINQTYKYIHQGYRAILLFEGINQFELQGEFSKINYIMNDVLIDSNKCVMQNIHPKYFSEARELSFSFFNNNAKCRIKFESMRLELLNPIGNPEPGPTS